MQSNLFPPSREFALKRLHEFLPRAGREYAKTRNYDLGPENRSNISLLSPYLRHRVLTEEEVIGAVLQHHSFQEAEKFIQEVLWRTYWKGWLELRPEVWDQYLQGIQEALEHLEEDSELRERYDRAIAGATGIECFDCWVGELKQFGYLHNHARMWFASIWIFTLQLPWQLGAEFFYRHLFDGDPASNTLSWRWVAGLQTKGKCYVARAANISKYTRERFSPLGQLQEDDVAPLSSDENITDPKPRSPIHAGPPRQPFLLVVHEDDLMPDESLLCSPLLTGVFFFEPSDESGLGWRESPVRRFVFECMRNLEERLGVNGIPLYKADLRGALTKSRASLIAYCDPNVGFLKKDFAVFKEQARVLGAEPLELRKDWDEKFFPYAKRGFFSFRAEAQGILVGLFSAS